MKRIFAILLAFPILFGVCRAASPEELLPGAAKISYVLYEGDTVIEGENPDQKLPIGSVSKLYTAALIGRLGDSVDPDKPLCDYLPEFTMADSRYRDITPRMLLEHTAGLYGSSLKNSMLYDDHDSWAHDHLLEQLSVEKLKSTPGTIRSYSNDGYSLLELLIERLSGKTYETCLSEMAKEFGLSDTSCRYDGTDCVNALGSGGICASANDVCRFVLQSGNTEGFDDVSLYPFDGAGITAYAKGGDTLEHHASVVFLPEFDICAAVIAEGGDSVSCQLLATELIRRHLAACGTEVPYYTTEREITDGTLDDCKRFEGIYLSSAAQYRFSLSEDGGVLKNLYTGGSLKLPYLGGASFALGTGVLRFEEAGNDVYMINEDTVSISDVKENVADYVAVRSEPGEIPGEAWQKRNAVAYFVCDEKYTSQLYLAGIPSTNIYMTEEMPGYIGYMKITGDDTAEAAIAVPGNAGRDLADLAFYRKDGVEYVTTQGWVFQDMRSIVPIYPGMRSICTVTEYTRWYTVGEAKGKKITADHTKNGMFCLYDARGLCTYSSLTNEGEAILPEGGYVAFAGEAGCVFDITLS